MPARKRVFKVFAIRCSSVRATEMTERGDLLVLQDLLVQGEQRGRRGRRDRRDRLGVPVRPSRVGRSTESMQPTI